MGRTPLQEQLGGRAARPTALDAFRLARRAFLDGRRVDMGVLARELDVNRATLYRWVGTREHLLVEVLWSLARRTFEKLLDDPAVVRPGCSRAASVLEAWTRAVTEHPGMQAFMEQEGELAARLLTTRATDYQARLVEFVRTLLAEDLDAHRMWTPLPREDAAFVVVRVIESYFYLDLITGERPDPGRAGRVLHALLPGQAPSASTPPVSSSATLSTSSPT